MCVCVCVCMCVCNICTSNLYNIHNKVFYILSIYLNKFYRGL